MTKDKIMISPVFSTPQRLTSIILLHCIHFAPVNEEHLYIKKENVQCALVML